MAVKQKVVDCEAPLQIILRALQDISAREGLQETMCRQIVLVLGTVNVPTEPASYMLFMEKIQTMQSILSKECCNQELIFVTLRALYDSISDVNRTCSPAMSIVLQLMDAEAIPGAVKYILSMGYPEQNLERALFTLCTWLTKWTWTENLGPLVYAFMKGLEEERHYETLLEVTLATIEPLFKMIVLPKSRKSVGRVVLHMLPRVQHCPKVFHKVIPHVSNVLECLSKEKTESSLFYLKQIVNLCMALMEHYPGYPALYEPLKLTLQQYAPLSNYQKTLECKSWTDSNMVITQSRLLNGKVGLNNLGNTCYMNSVLQALFMTKTFRNEVLLHTKDTQPLFAKLQILFALLQHSKKFSLSPNDILALLRPSGFSLGHQHDSSEFLGYLLDSLHEQEKNMQKNESEAVAGLPSTSLETKTTIVQQSFGGRMVTVSHCGECGTKSERFDSFRDLQLSFPSNSENQSVQTLLDYYEQPEALSGDNQYHCDVCGKLTDGEKLTKIVEAPPRLILTLKQFRYDPLSQQRTKLLQTVKFNREVCLEGAQYELYAAVVHCGSSVDSGHYYTVAKDQDDWYKFNDCSVIKVTGEELCRLQPPETPYILFYGRKDFLDPDNLPYTVLSRKLHLALTKDHSEYDLEQRRLSMKVQNIRHNRNDEPPPPGCGGGGFNNTSSSMFIC